MLMSVWSFCCLIHFCFFQFSESKLVSERSDESGQPPATTIIIIVIELFKYQGSLINTLPRELSFLFMENLQWYMGVLTGTIRSSFEEDLVYSQNS